jgi:hypothetical protein
MTPFLLPLLHVNIGTGPAEGIPQAGGRSTAN